MRAIGLALLAPALVLAVSATPVQAESILGTGIRVSDLDRSIRFYTEVLGMKEAARLPHGSLTEVMMTFGERSGGSAIILMKDNDPAKSPPLVLGNGFDKIVLDMADLLAVTDRMKKAGMPVGEMHGSMGVRVLFVTDPDGYRYELIERTTPANPRG